MSRMTLGEIKNLLNAMVLTSKDDLEVDVTCAYCADLMSDVLSFSVTSSLLITGLTNKQVIRTAEVANIKAIIFIASKRPQGEAIALASRKKIPLLVTKFSMFDACGRLYQKGLRCEAEGG